MRIFLDDVRHPCDCTAYMYKRIGKENPIYTEDWKVVKNYKEFVEVIEENVDKITHVSFDHDLADIHYDPRTWTEGFEYQEETGYDCAVWMKDFYNQKGRELPRVYVHSMNPVGVENISRVFG